MYKGDICKNVTACYSQPCQNDGKCTDTPTAFVCECPEKYGGDICNKRVLTTNESVIVGIITAAGILVLYTFLKILCKVLEFYGLISACLSRKKREESDSSDEEDYIEDAQEKGKKRKYRKKKQRCQTLLNILKCVPCSNAVVRLLTKSKSVTTIPRATSLDSSLSPRKASPPNPHRQSVHGNLIAAERFFPADDRNELQLQPLDLKSIRWENESDLSEDDAGETQT